MMTGNTIYKFEVSKSNRARCYHCSFTGEIIGKGKRRLQKTTFSFYFPIVEFYCDKCGKALLNNLIAEYKNMVAKENFI